MQKENADPDPIKSLIEIRIHLHEDRGSTPKENMPRNRSHGKGKVSRNVLKKTGSDKIFYRDPNQAPRRQGSTPKENMTKNRSHGKEKVSRNVV